MAELRELLRARFGRRFADALLRALPPSPHGLPTGRGSDGAPHAGDAGRGRVGDVPRGRAGRALQRGRRAGAAVLPRRGRLRGHHRGGTAGGSRACWPPCRAGTRRPSGAGGQSCGPRAGARSPGRCSSRGACPGCSPHARHTVRPGIFIGGGGPPLVFTPAGAAAAARAALRGQARCEAEVVALPAARLSLSSVLRHLRVEAPGAAVSVEAGPSSTRGLYGRGCRDVGVLLVTEYQPAAEAVRGPPARPPPVCQTLLPRADMEAAYELVAAASLAGGAVPGAPAEAASPGTWTFKVFCRSAATSSE
ncbi:unnamed protein product [Prorocentrum cordatum]|uniref:Uncharacterized protein n=1 Tax=Prorocentrum cordatum TaxID=2364126 RepID=A0ABN9SSS3_9DINO|nr:unnamed protein product [Polarella glacialis]